MTKLKGFEVVQTIPEGYEINTAATTTPNGYDLYCNNKSIFGGERKCILIKRG